MQIVVVLTLYSVGKMGSGYTKNRLQSDASGDTAVQCLAERPAPPHPSGMRMFRALGLALILAACSDSSGFAQSTPGTAELDPSAVQSVISGQIAAFLSGDGEKAYSFAAPSIRGQFTTVEQFMGMVRKGYAPVYAPRNYAFGKTGSTNGNAIQQVFVTGPDGRNWIAVYTLEHQSDGSWKINGCFIQPDKGEGA